MYSRREFGKTALSGLALSVAPPADLAASAAIDRSAASNSV